MTNHRAASQLKNICIMSKEDPISLDILSTRILLYAVLHKSVSGDRSHEKADSWAHYADRNDTNCLKVIASSGRNKTKTPIKSKDKY